MSWTLSKTFRFEASHQLVGHDGKCARLHGHSWTATVCIERGDLTAEGPKAGMVLDYGDVSAAAAPLVERYLDHHHLNETLETDRPTSEVIARWLFQRLDRELPFLRSVTVEETCTSRCTYERARP